jgi:hypothetical protein
LSSWCILCGKTPNMSRVFFFKSPKNCTLGKKINIFLFQCVTTRLLKNKKSI